MAVSGCICRTDSRKQYAVLLTWAIGFERIRRLKKGINIFNPENNYLHILAFEERQYMSDLRRNYPGGCPGSTEPGL